MGSPTLYLIDGSSYIFRAYFAIRHLSTSTGFPTNAIYGFTSMLFKFIKDYKPEYLGVVFDSKSRTFRNDIYPLYKANRDVPPDDLVPQFERIFEVVKAFSIPLVQMEGFEADDLMGTIAKENEKKGVQVVLVTGDKDFCQLVSNKITLLDTMKNKSTDIEEVISKFGVAPSKVIDLLALAGDAVDNIPGVKGIGDKTASKLIKKFGSMEKIYEHINEVGGKQEKLLKESKENAFMSKELVTIKTDIDTKADYMKFEYKGFNNQELAEIFDELEFKNLKRELNVPNGEADGRVDSLNSNSIIKYSNYKLVFSEKQLDKVIDEIRSAKEISLDLETTSHMPMFAKIVGIALSPSVNSGFYVPIGHKCDENQLSIDLVIDKIRTFIEDENIKKIGQNLKYELIVLNSYGLKLRGIYFDTIIAAHLLDSSRNNYKLDELSRDYLGHIPISYKDVTTKGKSKLNFSEVDLDSAKNYACEDSDVAMILYKKLYKELENNDLLYVYFERALKLVSVLAQMEINGVKIDTGLLNDLSDEFDQDLVDISKKIYSQVGYELNLNSPIQLREVLFDKLGLDVKKRTKTGVPSTDHEVLVELAKYHELPDLILKHRALSKLKSTYVDALPKLINPETGRIHTSYNPVGTSTGRVSSSDPNLQNIPIKTSEGKKIRKAFIPDEGFIFLYADYSQIDLRLLAHFSEDQRLIQTFIDGGDIHNKTASEIFGVSEKDVTPDMRRLAKNINFGIIYGISAFGLAKQLRTSVSESKKYIDHYFERYPKVRSYLDSSVKESQNRGFAVTILGRRRPIPELNSKNRVQRGFGERAAINTPIQGSAADIINLAMINISEKIVDLKSKMILQVHDELIFEVQNKEVSKISKMVKKEMEDAYKLKVPLKVEIGVGANWAEAH